MNTHPLAAITAEVRRRARRVVLLHAVGHVVLLSLGAVLAIGLFDAWLREEHVAVRWAYTMLVVAAIVWVLWRRLVPALRFYPTNVAIARRIEERYPALHNRLASAVDFLAEDDEATLSAAIAGDRGDRYSGSIALRDAVIADTAASAREVAAAEVVESRPAARAILGAVAAGIVVAAMVASQPQAAAVAWSRLWRPWHSQPWPRQHHLAFRNPIERIASGHTFEVELEDQAGELPREVRIFYRYPDLPDEVQSEPMQFLGNVMVARKQNVTRPFSYRAEGGDDRTMAWIDVEVIDPPRIEQIEVTLFPPRYTAWPPQKSELRIRALQGTRVELTARTDRLLASAALVFESGMRIPATLSSDGQSLSLRGRDSLTVKKNDRYWLELVDQKGLVSGDTDRYDIVALADSPPVVVIEQPATQAMVTADTRLPVRAVAKDNLAVKRIVLRYTRSDRPDDREQEIVLFTGPNVLPTAPAVASPGPEVASVASAGANVDSLTGSHQAVDYVWSLADLELLPQTQLTIYALAEDYQPLEARSDERRITIITPDELQDRLAQRQSLILAELQRILKTQREVRQQISEIHAQAANVGHLRRRDVELLQGAELHQRQIARSLGDSSEGVQTQIASLLSELQASGFVDMQMQSRAEELRSELIRLGKEHLPIIDRELTAARKTAISAASTVAESAPVSQPADVGERRFAASQPLIGSLAETGAQQEQIIAALERLLGDLARYQNYRELTGEIAQLRALQQQLRTDTVTLGGQTLGRAKSDLMAQQQTDLQALDTREADLVRRFEKLLGRMVSIADEVQKTNPTAAQTLQDGARAAQRLGVAGKMRQAGDLIGRNQLVQAGQQQLDVVQSLDELLDVLSGRREYELDRLVKKLRDAEHALAGLRDKQAAHALMADAAKAEPTADAKRRSLKRFAPSQAKVRDELEALARDLRQLNAEQVADKLGQASDSASAAVNAATDKSNDDMSNEGDTKAANSAQTTSEASRKALRAIDEAQRRLAARRRQAETDLAAQQLGQLQDAIVALKARQEKALAETSRLEGLLKAASGQRTRAQAQRVQDSAEEQSQLAGETSELAEGIAAGTAFRLALQTARARQAQAAKLLAELDTGATSQVAQQAAIDKFAQILAALKQTPSTGKPASQSSPQPSESASLPGAVRSRAELELLRSMQADLRQQTIALEKQFGGLKDLPTPAQEQYDRIAREQGELADLLLQMVAPSRAEPAEPEEKPSP